MGRPLGRPISFCNAASSLRNRKDHRVDGNLGMSHHDLMGSANRTFQNRARLIEDNGCDFEAFVFECFRYAKEERGFTKRLARGRDGAIDLLDRISEPGTATIAECKYIGSGMAQEATERWAEVYRNLSKNLPGLHADPAKTPKSPYRGWLDPERHVTRYRFCVTARMTESECTALEKRIASDFAKLVQTEKIEPLRALAENDGAIRVLPWDWFTTELEEHPSLAFRWFRGLPVGVELFEEESGNVTTFRAFLSGGELGYFSRDEYEDEGAGTLERGESVLVSGLVEGSPQALLITGPGGVGKTRLSWELSTRLAELEHGFEVFRLIRSATFESVATLADHHPANASILLLIDYAEAMPNLSDIADAVAHVSANTAHQVRVIATCRSSATNAVRDNLSVLDPEPKSLGSRQTGEEGYISWVTRSILNLGGFSQPEELARVCHGVPALAAFALFLFRYHRTRFDQQFGALHGLDDFDKWANHRIAILIGGLSGQRANERTLAQIALSLPLPVEQFRAIFTSNEALIEALRVDRWIEEAGDQFVAAHDVLADALAARWLFEAEHAATDRTVDLLNDAARNGYLGHALVALARLAFHPKFAEIDGAALSEALLSHHPEQVSEICGPLLEGPFLNFEEKLDLLHRSEPIRQTAKREPSHHVSLSFLAAEAVYRKCDTNDSAALRTLSDLLDDVCQIPRFSNMVLRRAYALEPARFRERVWAYLETFPQAEPTHFLLVQMLRSGEPSEALLDAVQLWLKANPSAPRASFVYKAWLDAGGGIEAVSEALLAWVGVRGKAYEAEFVYDAWLDAGGGVDAVSEALLAWVGVHGQTQEASHVYDAWLDAGGAVETVSNALLAWVGVHGEMPDASYVYNAWLDAGGRVETVSEALLAWVGEIGRAHV